MTDPVHADISTDDGTVGAGVARSSRSESHRSHEHSGASPHSSRFRTVTALLVALGVGAILVAVSVAVGGPLVDGRKLATTRVAPAKQAITARSETIAIRLGRSLLLTAGVLPDRRLSRQSVSG